MRVREDDRVQLSLSQMLPERLRQRPLVFGMGAAIQHDPAVSDFQKITVGADFDLACEISKTELRHAGCEKLGGTKVNKD